MHRRHGVMWRARRVLQCSYTQSVRWRSWFPDPTKPLQAAAKRTQDLVDAVAPERLKVAAKQTQHIQETLGKANLMVWDQVVESHRQLLSGQTKNQEHYAEKTRSAKANDVREHSHFWSPYAPDSPFIMGRAAYLRMHHHHTAKELVPDKHVEQYVDFLLSNDVLRNTPLPIRALVQPRQLYLRVVRLVLGVILHLCDIAEGDVMGKRMIWLKTPSPLGFRSSEANTLDRRVITKLAQRVLDDHINVSFFGKLGVPESTVLALYEDLYALTIRIMLDVALTFELRVLGHSIKISIDADEMLHTAPGWDIPLDNGAFGRFDDVIKREWVAEFVEDLLKDEQLQMPELPLAMQREMYLHVVVMIVHLGETAFNHCRCHIAGMSLRPAITSESAEYAQS